MAFRTLLRRHDGVIGRCLNEFFAPRGHDFADLRSEALLGFHKAVAGYKPRESSFRSFAGLCIERQLASFIKAATRHKHSPLGNADSLDRPIFAEDNEKLSLGDRLVDRFEADRGEHLETLGHLAAAVKQSLTERERSAVLGFAEGRPYEAIASGTGCGVKQVDNALQRGRRKLSAALEAAA